ncbi:HPr-rel-A system PqqD family peptide chaperone [Novosphingopyxis sp. YJ-S2-01]|uniref:HPr-rel-A system PqqD family peptide chaperone n=1 Tax=Novosphingopyxis sp. YJ-S2-01 TaxID=2794021 RepID=UPI0018DC4006|nr:HPr-rel-A system PqqD family peptide chaperone [Novosphingopyxis sp. YJ-S2-01]MBH9536489.1 HPr-rel-A system PqqD family peptide chaperone [Novosphingopyxis sp. YJ-S2-01]
MDDEPLYIRAAAADLVWHPLEALTLVYDRRSGITHIVVEPVPEIMEAMGDAPASAADLAERLSARFDLEGDAASLIGARLTELAALGLIERKQAHA